MDLFWKKDAPRHQKWLVSMMLVVVLPALAPMFWRGFVPAPHWQNTAWYLAAIGTLVLVVVLWNLHRHGLWKPVGFWSTASPVKRWLMAPLCLMFFAFILWLDIAATLPMAYTKMAGEPAQRMTLVEKKRSSGRRSCHYQLKVKDIKYLFFEFCVNEEYFDTLPDGPIPVLLQSRRTIFGEDVESLRF